MKIAVFADIHGNHIALETCLNYCKSQNIDTFLFLGDYIGEMPNPQATMKLLYELNASKQCYFISGNKEDYWINYKNSGEQGWKDYNSVTGSLLYSYQHLLKQDLDFFMQLPKKLSLQLDGMPVIDLQHIPPYKPYSAKEVYEKNRKCTTIDGPIRLCGHRHIQGIIDYEGSSYLNPGSVGVPLYSHSKTQFIMMDYAKTHWNIDYISLDYNVEKLIQEMYEEKLDQHAPCWTRMSINNLKGGNVSHVYGLKRAMEITKEKYGECNWPEIPEECFEQALAEIENTTLN